MNCKKCGTLLDENAKYCQECGIKVEKEEKKEVNIVENKTSNPNNVASIVLGILAIIGSILVIFSPLAFILSVVGLILGIIGNKKDKNVVGIVLTSVGLFLSIISILLISVFIWFIVDTVDDYDYDYDKFNNVIEKYENKLTYE